jgi:hypothetical protein
MEPSRECGTLSKFHEQARGNRARAAEAALAMDEHLLPVRQEAP